LAVFTSVLPSPSLLLICCTHLHMTFYQNFPNCSEIFEHPTNFVYATSPLIISHFLLGIFSLHHCISQITIIQIYVNGILIIMV
jgi:hypothetical protein